LAGVFSARDARGVLARRLLPGGIILVFFLGWLRVVGEEHDLYEPRFGVALYAVVFVLLLTVLVIWSVLAVGRVEAERAAINARLAALNRRKDEMIAVVSHDLCSPLTGFRMVIDLLRERNEPTEDLLNLMDHSARRMVAMVRGLLDVSKLQSDKMELERKDILVSDLVRHSIQPLKINADAKQITLNLAVAEGEPQISADPLRVTQIFNNLLSNAVKFTGRGGSVSIAVAPEERGVTVSISDTGLGIPAAELEHIFDKFHQTSTKATEGEAGAGLGLAIVRELVLLHGGKISVNSQVGEGTTFAVYLPQTPGPTRASGDENPGAASVALAKHSE
jgi:signal transduction histidine kinase